MIQRLAEVPARLFFHERCARLLECLPSLQHDPNRPEDVLKVDADEDGIGGETWRSAICGGLFAVSVGDKGGQGAQRKLRGL